MGQRHTPRASEPGGDTALGVWVWVGGKDMCVEVSGDVQVGVGVGFVYRGVERGLGSAHCPLGSGSPQEPSQTKAVMKGT